jgi:hypothetical protein
MAIGVGVSAAVVDRHHQQTEGDARRDDETDVDQQAAIASNPSPADGIVD